MTEKEILEAIEFWKKTQRLNIALLKRIAVHAEMSNRVLVEITATLKEESLQKTDAWFLAESKKTREALTDLIFRQYGELDISDLFSADDK